MLEYIVQQQQQNERSILDRKFVQVIGQEFKQSWDRSLFLCAITGCVRGGSR